LSRNTLMCLFTYVLFRLFDFFNIEKIVNG
jgi:hypothetical protein